MTQGGEFSIGLWLLNVTQPEPRSRNGPCTQDRLGVLILSMVVVQARPRPVFGSRTEVCPQCVSFHISTDGEKVFVFLNGEGLEPSLIQMAAAGRASAGCESASASLGNATDRHSRAARAPNAGDWASGSRTRPARRSVPEPPATRSRTPHSRPACETPWPERSRDSAHETPFLHRSLV